MTPRGFEPTAKLSISDKDLRQSENRGAAFSGAVSADALFAQIAQLSKEDRERMRALLSDGRPPA
jgi:L-lactate utilization protein LutC